MRPNHGVRTFWNMTIVASASPSTVQTQSAAAYEWIKPQLMAGSFPRSARLGEARVARELDLTQAPVRQALARLHAEGLLDRHPGGGFQPGTVRLTRTR